MEAPFSPAREAGEGWSEGPQRAIGGIESPRESRSPVTLIPISYGCAGTSGACHPTHAEREEPFDSFPSVTRSVRMELASGLEPLTC